MGWRHLPFGPLKNLEEHKWAKAASTHSGKETLSTLALLCDIVLGLILQIPFLLFGMMPMAAFLHFFLRMRHAWSWSSPWCLVHGQVLLRRPESGWRALLGALSGRTRARKSLRAATNAIHLAKRMADGDDAPMTKRPVSSTVEINADVRWLVNVTLPPALAASFGSSISVAVEGGQESIGSSRGACRGNWSARRPSSG